MSMYEAQLFDLRFHKSSPMKIGETHEIIIPDIASEGITIVFQVCKIYHSDMCHSKSIIAQLKHYYELIDSDAKISNNTTCRKGCSDCCKSNFEISMTEFFMILNYLNINYSKEYIRKVSDQAKITVPQSSCLFVNKTTQACDIYEVRPLICRKFGLYDTEIICDKLSERDMLKGYIDTHNNVDEFTNPYNISKKIILPSRTMIYWFSSLENGDLKIRKLNDMFEAAFNEPVKDFVKICLL